MAQDANGIFSPSIGVTPQGVSINDSRRIFNFGERVAELNPAASPFFAYLSKVAKKPTDDPVFKFLEKRHQWQRRNFFVKAADTLTADGSWIASEFNLSSFEVDVDYDIYGRKVSGGEYKAEFLQVGQMIAMEATATLSSSASPVIAYYRITGVTQNSTDTSIDAAYVKAVKTGVENGEISTYASGDTLVFADNGDGQVIGSAYLEGDTAPVGGWRDEFFSREGYAQIFKTVVPLFSGTSLATRYRGDANEYMRVYQEKLMEHKMDLEHAMLFGIGSDDSTASGPIRRTWGIVPFVEQYGKVKTLDYANANYDTFIDTMEDVFSPESGNSGEKLVLASRKVISYFNKLGGTSFLGNTMALNNQVGSGLDIQNVEGSFGHNVTRISTIYGNLNLVMEPLFRGPYENTAIMVDLNNVAYRPLVGNGVSRDTQIITNVQDQNVDGRKDMILTEAGLEISLPETHTVLQFFS